MGATDELARGKAKIMGVVFNGMRLDKEDYYYSKYYKSSYRYRGYGEKQEHKKKEPNSFPAE